MSANKPFAKPAKTFEEQCDILISRGMEVPDKERAIYYLSHINYYRLEAYWLPFEVSREPHQFSKQANFDVILNHYVFDRQLRLLMLDAIERFEVSFRAQWAYHISHHCGPHGYLENRKGLVKNANHLASAQKDLKEQTARSDEVFITHYRDKYAEPLPPAWVASEVMSFNLVSRFYSNLRAYKVRQAIAATYQFDETFLEGFLEHICYVRNICAHHSRLWNRHFTKKMPLPKGKPKGLKDNIFVDSTNKTEHKIYNTIVLMQHLMQTVCPESDWAQRLESLIDEYPIDIKRMGFPVGWKSLPLWQTALSQSAKKGG